MPKPTGVPGLTARTPLSVAGPLLVRARLADVSRFERAFGAAAEPDADAVHDMRVAARRLRAALVLFGRRPLAALEPEVKALQDALGGLRDVHVQRGWLSGAARSGLEVGAIQAWIEGRRASAEKKARRAVTAWQASVAVQVEESAPGVRRGRLGGKAIAERVDEHLGRLGRRVEGARRRSTPRRLHRVRIAAKKLRYVVELVRPAFHGASEVLDTLVPLQEQLGEVHDLHVRIDLLERLTERGHASERREAAILLERVRQEGRPREEALRRELARWEEERVVRTVRKTFR